MPTNRDYSGLSELEREIELEMDEELERDDEGDERFEAGDEEHEDVLELEGAPDEEGDEELGGERDESEYGDSGRDQEFVDRFLEIASREFESEAEVDQAMNETLSDVANEYLFGSLWKKAKRLGKSLASNSIVRSLVNKGLSVASGQFPALKAALQLAKGNLQGALLNLGKQALGTVVPGGGAALGALKALGVDPGGNQPNNQELWENYVQLSREAFEHLANNVTASADHPVEASRLASAAFQHAVKRAQARAQNGMRGFSGRRRFSAKGGRVVRHRLRPGEKLIITGAHKLIVRGR
jgi:hypothetical protein